MLTFQDECNDEDNDEDYEEEEELEPEQEQLEKSAELQTFHETLSQLQVIEEQVFEEHRDLIQVGVIEKGCGVIITLVGIWRQHCSRGSLIGSSGDCRWRP